MGREQTHATSAQKGRTGKQEKGRGAAQQGKGSAQQGKSSAQGRGGSSNSPVQVQKFLGGVDYPVNKEDLIQTARDQKADREVMGLLERLPERSYDSPASVSREVAKLEKRGTA